MNIIMIYTFWINLIIISSDPVAAIVDRLWRPIRIVPGVVYAIQVSNCWFVPVLFARDSNTIVESKTPLWVTVNSLVVPGFTLLATAVVILKFSSLPVIVTGVTSLVSCW